MIALFLKLLQWKFCLVFFFLPAPAAIYLMRLASELVFRIARATKLRKSVAQNISRLFPQADHLLLADRLLKNVACSIFEILCVPYFKPAHIENICSVRNLNYLESALAPGHGVILLGMHTGNYELVPAALSGQKHKMTFVLKANSDPIFKIINRSRSYGGSSLINVLEEDMYRSALKALNNNDILGLLVDTGALEGRHEMISFLGKKVPAAIGWIALAQRSKASVLPGFVRREGDKVVLILGEPLTIDHHNKEEALQKVAGFYEKLIEETPDQWAIFLNEYEVNRMMEGGEINDQFPISNEGKIINNKKIHSFVTRNSSFVILALLSLALYFFKLGSFSLYDAAETTYGEFVKNILHSGNWLTLQYNGQIIFDKPPLYYWLVAILSKLVGFSEFAMRFPAAMAGVLTVITTYALGKKLYNERTGFLSGIIVMTAFQFLVQSRIAELDVLLAFFFSFSLLLFYHGYQTGNKLFYALIGIPLGLGIIVKGLLGFAVPAFAIFLFLLIKKKLSELLDLHVFLALLVSLLIGLPWYIAEYLIHGKVFLDFALGFLFLSRFGGVVSGHTGPWYYYFLALLLGFVPWSQFIPLAFWKTLKSWRNDPELLCLCLCLPTFIVFSIAKTKIPNYILPLYPFLAIMVGKLWDDFLTDPQKEAKGMKIYIFSFLIVVFLIFIGIIILGNSNYPAQYQVLLPPLVTIAGILLVGGFLSILFFFLKAYYLSFASLPTIVFAITLLLTFWALPIVEDLKGMKQLCEKVKKNIKPYEIIAVYNIGNRPSVVFYNPKPVVFLNNEKEVDSFLTKKKGYCFTLADETPKFNRCGKIFFQKGDLAVLH